MLNIHDAQVETVELVRMAHHVEMPPAVLVRDIAQNQSVDASLPI
jgi:hypothetical protein